MHSLVASVPSQPSILSLSPARLWIADASLTAPVSSWPSLVGGSVATQSNASYRPASIVTSARLRNKPCVVFDGNDRLIDSISLDCSTGWTVARVIDFDWLKNEQGIARLAAGELTGTSGLGCYITVDGNLVVGNAGNSWYRIALASCTHHSAYAIIMSCDGTAAGITVEVGLIAAGTITWSLRSLTNLTGVFSMPSASGLYVVLGGGWSSGSSLLNGRFAFEAWWTRVLMESERTVLKNILQRDYA